jgi:hypothetical protein
MENRAFHAALVVLLLTASLAAAREASWPVELRRDILTVRGKPFYPLGTWSDGLTTPEELLKLGMNVHFLGIGPSPQGPANLGEIVKRFSTRGILLIPYFGFGGSGTIPWAKADLESYLKPLGDSAGILAWYIGDDLTEVHLPGMSATADTVHSNDRMHPVVADYIAEPGRQDRATFRRYLDIMCQYGYPAPDGTLADYARFFDEQRQAVGDPLWTWVQAFMWAHTGSELSLGAEGPGPIPEPEQVRLLTYVALNRGVRGILFFAIQHFRTASEISAEIAQVCREIKLAEPYLAAGKMSLDIPTSDPIVRASSFSRPEGSVAALVIMGPNYLRWVDEAVRENVSFTVSCGGESPRAVLLTLPKPIECRVARVGRSRVRVTVPRLEMGGLVLVTSRAAEIERASHEAARLTAQVARMAVLGAAAQLRKVAGAYYSLGSDLSGGQAILTTAQMRLEEACQALDRRQPGDALLGARNVLLLCRRVIDATMRLAESRRPMLTELEQRNLKLFYSLPHLPGLLAAMPDSKEYRFLREFAVIGPFPLDMVEETEEAIPPGFERPYPPEKETDFLATYDGMAGPVHWQFAHAGFDARLNLEQYIAPSRNAVAYAHAAVTAPRDMETIIGLGSNDGVKVWVNGRLVFVHHVGRYAAPNQESFGVKLRAGKNIVLVKIENWGGRWELYLSVRDPDNALSFSAR